jgi:hypothetical protein
MVMMELHQMMSVTKMTQMAEMGTFEDAFSLPLCRIRETNPYVHMSGSTQRGIKTLDVIGRGEKKPVRDDEKPT